MAEKDRLTATERAFFSSLVVREEQGRISISMDPEDVLYAAKLWAMKIGKARVEQHEVEQFAENFIRDALSHAQRD